ncbi:MAG: dockerin type I repeat-containing protein [Oscillospiraceae bacterium]|nr:dockerin type I repeat-containing protein [Oscillospiraceae bacterium]
MKRRNRILGILTALTMLTGIPAALPASAAETGSRILVDIDRNDGRKASYTKYANNWLVDGTYTYTVNGITCKLSGSGGSVDLVNNKILQLQDIEKTPTLTMDGAKLKDVTGTPTLTLTITGLPGGAHSIRTWHACCDRNVTNSSLTVKIAGKEVAKGLQCPVNPTNSEDAATAYGTFSGTSVTVEITADGNGTLNTPWLNAFEIDGADPFRSVSYMTPRESEAHLLRENGLSWLPGDDAVSHNVYIGTDHAAVSAANENSPEFRGNVTEPKFALDESYSSVPTYYWRVDEVNKDGSIVPGAVYSFRIARLAFPTAEGYGRFARGGRGGYVYHVTNLSDDGKEGSLRYGLCTLKGARTIVFDVGGVITLSDTLCIPEDGGDVYVAGQTAPGDGITLINYDFGAIGAQDVILRDIRVRVGDVNGSSHGGMGMSSCNHSIVDHCSISWATDEGFSSRSAANLTFQWNIIGESLNNSVHYDANDRSKVERHAFAASIGGYTGSFHHNLLINNTGRNWSLAGAMEQDGQTYGGQLDISNNVVYNWKDRTTDGGARRVQFVNNYYKAGPVSNTSLHLVSVDGNELNTSDMQMLYASGNMKVAQNGSVLIAANADEWSSGKAVCGMKGNNANANTIRSNTPWFENHITLDPAEDAYKKVINNTSGAGANKPALDYIDSRYHDEVTNGKYTYTGSKDKLQGIIDSQNDVGGYPNSTNFKGGTAPADTDRDGMPDAWETEHGLNPNDAKDGAIVSLSGDDYTNLELYLNELAGDPVEFNGTPVTYDPIESELFSAVILDTAYYASWGIDEKMEQGDAVFGDRSAEKCAVNDAIGDGGAQLLLTPCDAKNSGKEQAVVTAKQDMILYVGLDSRVEQVPAWLGAFERIRSAVTTSNDVTFGLYRKSLKAGESVTLGANGQSAYCMNYIVIAVPDNHGWLHDLNADGSFDTLDLVLLQQWLLAVPGTTLPNADVGDMNGDGVLDVFDLGLMKRELTEK